MKLVKLITLHDVPGDSAQAFAELDAFLDDVARGFGLMRFGTPPATVGKTQLCENFDGVLVVYRTNSVANTDDVVNHGLERTPVLLQNIEMPVRTGETPNSGRVYFGATAPNSRQVTLRCTGTSKLACVFLA